MFNIPSEPASQQASPPVATPATAPNDSTPPPPPASTLNLYELTFGSVCGVCAGVFIKKGAKFVAFMLGGTFVLLQVGRGEHRLYSACLTSPLRSTSDPSPSSGSTGPGPQAVSKTCSTGRRTVSDALPRSHPFGTGSSPFWPQTSSHGLLLQLGWSSVCGSVKLRVCSRIVLRPVVVQ